MINKYGHFLIDVIVCLNMIYLGSIEMILRTFINEHQNYQNKIRSFANNQN